MNKVFLPIPSWFAGDSWDPTGNCYVGSIGADTITKNAFCYRVWLERVDKVDTIKAECYDVLSSENAEEHKNAEFPGLEEGCACAQQWLDQAYEDYLRDRRDKLTVSFY